jgi:hypothetical protein
LEQVVSVLFFLHPPRGQAEATLYLVLLHQRVVVAVHLDKAATMPQALEVLAVVVLSLLEA